MHGYEVAEADVVKHAETRYGLGRHTTDVPASSLITYFFVRVHSL
jgi:hypothetical protein